MNMKRKITPFVSLLLALQLSISVLVFSGCTPSQNNSTETSPTTQFENESDTSAPETQPDTLPQTDADTEKETESEPQTEPETEVQTEADTQPEDEIVERNIEERYFIFRIWNFNERGLNTFKSIVDTAQQAGFTAIKIHIPWDRVEKTDGVYEYTAFDDMVDYVVAEKGMKVAISLDMSRRAGDSLIPEEDIQRDREGNLCVGGAYYARTAFSFCSEYAVAKATAFYTDAVKHFDSLYGEEILFYLPAFSQYCETEYWCAGEYDYSEKAVTAFRSWLAQSYSTIEDFNRATGRSYASFDEIIPPSCTASDSLGVLWYQFRHQKLKAMIDTLATAQKEACPNTKITIQLGCVFDSVAATRCTLGFVDLCERVDVLWLDDGPAYDHAWSMDYVRSMLPAHIALAQEIDGPLQANASVENYLDQGLTAFEREATYVSIANWDINDYYYRYEDTWKQIASTWLCQDPPAVLKVTQDSPVLEVSLYDMFRMKSPDGFISKYHSLAQDGQSVRIKVIDDLTGRTADSTSLSYTFPSGFSAEQGTNGWYYMNHRRGKFTEMTYDAEKRWWQGAAAFNLIMADGTVHPDTYDTALVFEVPADGTVQYYFLLSLISDQSDGVRVAVMRNDERIYPADSSFASVAPASTLEETLTITVQKGDRIALIVNQGSTHANDSSKLAVFVDYQ